MIVGIAAVAALIAAQAARADARAGWRVVEASGALMLTSDDARCLAVDPRRDLPVGAVVETGKDGNLTLMRGEDSLVVSPGSRLTLLPDHGAETRVAQDAGMAWFRIGKKSAPHFSVRTQELTATVKGTTFTVAIDASGAAVHVREGAVEVATGWRDAVTLVKAGTLARVRRAAPDRITLMSGSAVRTVTSFDTSEEASPGALRLGGGAPGSLFATGHADRPAALAAASWVSSAAPAARIKGRAGASHRTLLQPAAESPMTNAPAGLSVSQPTTGSASHPSRRAPSTLPLLETVIAALALLIIMVTRTFFGTGGEPKAVKAERTRR